MRCIYLFIYIYYYILIKKDIRKKKVRIIYSITYYLIKHKI